MANIFLSNHISPLLAIRETTGYTIHNESALPCKDGGKVK